MKRLFSLLLSFALAAPPLFALAAGVSTGSIAADLQVLESGLLGELDDFIDRSFPWRESFFEFGLDLRLAGGATEQNQIFISQSELILNIDPPVDSLVRENTAAILEFSDNIGVPTYFMLVPTASAIRQQSLPAYTHSQVFNQKRFIEEIGSQMAGRVTVVDAYPVLFNARDEYIYYRTENSLTALGGYYLYATLGNKLLEGMQSSSMSDYDIEYVYSGYYGELYRRSPYKNVRSDTLFIYYYLYGGREYTVRHISGDTGRTYNTLYPSHLPDMGRPTDIYLGGLSAVTDIHASTPYENSLLIFGDKTALSYVPFLANHYERITVVDLFRLDADGYESIDPHQYSQILFAYGVESYMHTNNPSRALHFLDYLY